MYGAVGSADLGSAAFAGVGCGTVHRAPFFPPGQIVLITRPVNGSSGAPLTASTMEGIPAGASTVMKVPALTDVPVVLKFRVLVDVNDPEEELTREPETLPVIVIAEAETAAARTGREKLRVSTLVRMS